jgi:DNA-binding XRE family transcriptional regulator
MAGFLLVLGPEARPGPLGGRPVSALKPASASVVFGRRVRDLRNERGWTLRDAAPRAFLDPATLSRIENGADTTIGTAGRIAAAYGVSLAVLLPWADCAWCLDSPPRGFTCQECGTPGLAVAG